MSYTYIKPGDGVKARVAAYFRRNPDEELTYEQAVEKFNANLHTLKQGVHELMAEGLLESVHVIRLRSKGAAK